MANREKRYQDHLRIAGLEFLKMSVKSPVVLLDIAKEVILGGKTRFITYNENELVYEIKPTKLGELKKDLKNKNTLAVSQLYYELNKGTYPNKPFQGMLIERLDKPDKPRLIKIPAVTDRIVYTLLLKRIETFFEDDVKSYPIYGLTDKGVSLAIRRLASAISGESIILKLDFQSYFDTIPRGKLLEKVRGYKVGGEELKLIKAAINAPTNIPKSPKNLSKKHGHKFKPYETKIGLPQGCAFSPLLASIYALDVEKYLKDNNVFSLRASYSICIFIFIKRSAFDMAYCKGITRMHNLLTKCIFICIFHRGKTAQTTVKGTDMLVACKGNELRIEGVNDLSYVLKHIPSEIAAYQKTKSSSTKVVVTLQVDGVFTRNVQFDRDTKEGKADIDAVEKKIKAKQGEFALTGAQVVQIFSVRMTLSYEYVLGKCAGKEIVDAITESLKELKTNGFVAKEPPLEDAEAA